VNKVYRMGHIQVVYHRIEMNILIVIAFRIISIKMEFVLVVMKIVRIVLTNFLAMNASV
jgi:hypothetical protein